MGLATSNLNSAGGDSGSGVNSSSDGRNDNVNRNQGANS